MLRLVGPLHLVSADQCAPQLEESLADVGPPLIAYLQPPVADQPRQSPPTKSSPPPMPTQLSMPQVSDKNSSRKPGDQARLPTPRYRIPMRAYEFGFPRRSLLGFSVNKGPEPLAAYVTISRTHTQFFGNVLDRSDPSVEIAG